MSSRIRDATHSGNATDTSTSPSSRWFVPRTALPPTLAMSELEDREDLRREQNLAAVRAHARESDDLLRDAHGGDAEATQHSAVHCVVRGDEPEQQMLGPDVGVPEQARLDVSGDDHPPGVAGEVTADALPLGGLRRMDPGPATRAPSHRVA